MGRRSRQRGRPITGILLLDKPVGLTSNGALQVVKRLFNARKAGHTGSLDPLASGMLPICFGDATRVSGFLLDADKVYHTGCRLGATTTTGDAEGEVLQERPVPALDADAIEAVLARFRGDIEQVPPMYSALRHEGRRLYDLAREGVEVERKARAVTIHALDEVVLDGDRLEFRVHCSKGTYVRSLVEDIGEALGCGAHVTSLRRLAVGPYTDAGQMVSREQLQELFEAGEFEAMDALMVSSDTALMQFPAVRVDADSAHYLRHGNPVLVPRAPTEGRVRIYEGETFLGMGEILDDGRVAPRRLFLGEG